MTTMLADVEQTIRRHKIPDVNYPNLGIMNTKDYENSRIGKISLIE